MSVLIFRRNLNRQKSARDTDDPDQEAKIIEFPSYLLQALQLEAASRSLQVVLIMIEELTKEIHLLSLRPGLDASAAAFTGIAFEANRLAEKIAQANQNIAEEIDHVQSMLQNLSFFADKEEADRTVAIVSENITKIIAAIEVVFSAVQSARMTTQSFISSQT